ncbi:hypothetical protein P8A18_31265 [Streptomyces castrisilvae]|uniref:Uncharacterized protein n=1 Tax=Streptomyces castrisilvae TaxID=3033811 RepID=A0ABY9HUH5_9ACTN|nr:hypothetical protein [Streptomyces sp. Mut1]WLQ37647.1 hypothetical protein P8A18_31265 [Streptomyces sp. Mut1]
MSTVHARVWRFTIQKGKAGAEAVEAREIAQGPIPVSLAAMVNVNALACDLRKTVDKSVRDHEISLLLSYILGGQGKGPLSVDCSALDSSALHIQRFVSECTGLGVMSAASEVLFDWSHTTGGLSSFDVLPGKLGGVFAQTGVRPDLLYDLAAGPVAGEARGRRRRAKQMFPAGKGTTDQRKRLEKLAQWSVAHGDHAYFMSWVWLGPGGVYVDIFLPEQSAALKGLKTGLLKVTTDQKPWQFHVPRPDRRREVNMIFDDVDAITDDDHEMTLPGITGQGAVRQAIRKVGPAAEEAMSRAFNREANQLGTFRGVPVRGRWIRGDVLGEARHEVLVGVLQGPVELNRHEQRKRLTNLTGDRLDTFLDGRLLTTVRTIDGPRPSWDRISAELLG